MTTISPLSPGATRRPSAGVLLAVLLGPLVVVAVGAAVLAAVGLATGRAPLGDDATTQVLTLLASLAVAGAALLSIRWGFTGEWERRLGL